MSQLGQNFEYKRICSNYMDKYMELNLNKNNNCKIQSNKCASAIKLKIDGKTKTTVNIPTCIKIRDTLKYTNMPTKNKCQLLTGKNKHICTF